MKINEIIKIRNCVGILDIKLIKELNPSDVSRGNIEEMNFCGNMRLEYHKNYSNDTIITLTERNEEKRIIVAYLTVDGIFETYLGEIQGSERPDEYFVTIYGDDK
ncbi:MAG: hypothetical protein PHR96_04975 [Clostridia bacterium]|jgi:hypothetical protein|nr:hypothetical protein [Clostridia bacterium]